TDAGAIVTFTGLVRELYQGQEGSGRIEQLFLEHYPGMTEASLGKILDAAHQRWQLLDARIIHRVGALRPGDQIVYVGTASAHRGEAFEAARFIMDYLKTDAPFWKKQTMGGQSHWVQRRDSDEQSLHRWQQGKS
ncbi:MAG: molybdenum cofactor biosynthesis protein MoaE, partial [Gammaproteobacteria bacterium]